jgi:putative transposase
MITRTEQIWNLGTPQLSNLSHFSKNLWNEALFMCRGAYFHNKYNPEEPKQKIPNYSVLAGTLKNSENYQALNAQTAQQILKVLAWSWTSYWKSIKEWSNHPEKFLGIPKPPGYKPKDGESFLIFTNQQCKIINGYLEFPESLKLEHIKTRLPDSTDLREVRIIPAGTGYIYEIVYIKLDEEEIINKRWYSRLNNKNRIIGIDLGVRNTVTIGNNIGLVPIVVKGGILKSINQFYNKQRAKFQSEVDKAEKIKFAGTKVRIIDKFESSLLRLTDIRNCKIKDIMHKLSRYIADYCEKHDIGTVVIGYNGGWKQKSNMGRQNNQNFVSIPFYTFVRMLFYKLDRLGIKVIEQEESHTSKCSFLDDESIEHHECYAGKRITRGLFRSVTGIIINADVQGALNIIRKAIPDAFAKGIEDVVLHPIKVTL